MIRVSYSQGVYLPDLGLWLDPAEPKPLAFISHAHSDHIAPHERVILSEPTARLMRARLGGTRDEIVLEYGREHVINGWRIVLLPAGHIFGSAQIHLSSPQGDSLIYTGDFKVRPGLSAEPIEFRHATTLVMETTYGLPHFCFPPTEAVLERMLSFCRDCIEDGDVPVLLGYSLGKAQEILSSLAGASLVAVLHPAVAKITSIYEQLGHGFPPYKILSSQTAREGVVICPPQVAHSRAISSIPNRRLAVLTGWAVDPAAKFRYQCEEAFPLSDHAGYDDLLKYVEMVAPRRVLTLHGFAREFAADLRRRGFDAWALTGENQMEIPLEPGPTSSLAADSIWERRENKRVQGDPNAPVMKDSTEEGFGRFAAVCEEIRAVSGKIRKRSILADYLNRLPDDELRHAVVFLCGQPFPQVESRVTQAGWAIIRRALLRLTSLSETQFRQISRGFRDAGLTATEALRGVTHPRVVSLAEISAFFDQLAKARGPEAKIVLLEKQFFSLSALESGYVVRILTGDLRIGLKEGLIEESIADAFGCPMEAVREAHMLTGDPGQTALLAKKHRLDEAALVPLRPIKCMLASAEPDAISVWRRFTVRSQKELHRPKSECENLKPSVWIEDKFDGIRAQLHRASGRVEIFSRDLKPITEQFQEVARNARLLGDDAVLDGEIVAYEEGRKLTFFDLQKRLGRNQHDLFLPAEIPVVYVVFDILWLKGASLLHLPLSERRMKLEALQLPHGFRAAMRHEVSSPEEIDRVFLEARKRGNEGLMIKDPASPYTPGRRGHAWLKLKKEFATLDVVVTAVEQGHGRRSGVLSDYTFAVRDEKGALRNIGKAYSGLTDLEIAELTEHFEAHGIERKGGWLRVEPNVVIEVAFDSIQPSNRYDSGLSLRFPRIKAIRKDKTVLEIDTLATAKSLLS